MGLIAKKGNDADFEMIPAGNHIAICYRVIDLGFHSEQWQGKSIGDRPKIRLVWELCDEKMMDGRPFSISAKFTNSLNSKARLCSFLEAWRGRPFTQEELEGFDVSKLLCAPCMLNVIHEPGKKDPSKVYSSVSSVARLPKSVPTPELFNTPLYFDMDDPTPDVWNLLPQFIQNECRSSIFWPATEAMLNKRGGSMDHAIMEEMPPLQDDAPPF